MTIETKYNIGNIGYWAGSDGTCKEGEICGIFIYKEGIKYTVKEYEIRNKIYLIYVDEQNLFPTKEELLRSL